MSHYSDFDLEVFQAKVLEKVDVLEGWTKSDAEFAELSNQVACIDRRGRKGPGWWLSLAMLKFSEKMWTWTIGGYKKDKKGLKYREQAKQLLSQERVRERLCFAFQSAESDVKEVAKVVTSVLVPLVLSKVFMVPLDALFFAFLSQELARIGVASYCAHVYDEELGRS